MLEEGGWTYTPREETPRSRDDCQWAAVPYKRWKERLLGQARRWWILTTEPKYLVSAVSRRNSWRVLLPLPGVLAMLADTGRSDLVILDTSVAIGLLAAGFMPCSRLFSDCTIALLHAAFNFAHNYVLLRKQLLDEVEEMSATWSCQVLSMFAMSFAGLHSLALAGFGMVMAISTLLFRFDWTCEQAVACCCIFATASFSEQRLAWFVCERRAHDFGYKALNSTATQHEDVCCGHRLSPRSVAVDHHDSGPEDTVPRGNDSDDFEESCYSGGNTIGSSRLSLADYVISRLSPSDAASQPSMAGYVFSRLLANPAAASRAARGSPQRHRFAAAQVQMPGAASHEAPLFSRHEQIERAGSTLTEEPSGSLFGQGFEGGAIPEVAEPSREPAGWWASGKGGGEYQAMLPEGSPQKAALNFSSGSDTPGPKAPDTEVSCPNDEDLRPRFAEPPASPPASIPEPEKPVVLRGIKMAGFQLAELNVLFVESTDRDTTVNGRETYWSAANDYFLYRSEATSTWGAAKARRLQAVRDGTSNGVAHSPEGFEIWDSQAVIAHSKRGWREWDSEHSKWVNRPGSGVESRGKVRPKASPLEKASQAKPETCNQGCQTDAMKKKDVPGSPIAEITPETS